MISDIVMSLAFFSCPSKQVIIATSVVVKWCVKYCFILYGVIWAREHAEVVIILGFALLSNAYLTYSTFVADCLWRGPSVHWIPNFLWCPMYRIEYIWWWRGDIIRAAYKTSSVAQVVRSTPYILGAIIWTMTTWLVAWYNDKRCGRCMVYTDRYAVFHAYGANLKICTFFMIGLHNFIISIFRGTLYIETS